MQANEERGDPNHKSVLIVDDDADALELLELVFKGRGYHTTPATSGSQALACLEASQPDVILLDVMMPEMDGWEAFRRVRQRCSAPVIFLTALTEGKMAARALELGVDDYVRKPYSVQELLARVETLVRGDRQGSGRQARRWNRPGILGTGKVMALIPAHDEARFIGSTVLKACQYADEVVVVDDGSSDNTADLAELAGALVVSHDRNLGKGSALNTGFQTARQLGADVVVMLDADGQHSPEELDQVVEPVLAGEADIVIGSRYLETRCKVPVHRVLGHRAFNWITHLASGTPASDSQSGYRAFSSKAVEAISFHSTGFSVESEMQFIARELDLRLVEVPVTIQYTDRPKRSVVAHGMQVLNGVLHLVGQYRPLLFFGLPGAILLLVGMGWGLWVVEIFRKTRTLAAGYAMLSMLLTVLGMLSLSTGIILHSVRALLIDLDRSRNPDRYENGFRKR